MDKIMKKNITFVSTSNVLLVFAAFTYAMQYKAKEDIECAIRSNVNFWARDLRAFYRQACMEFVPSYYYTTPFFLLLMAAWARIPSIVWAEVKRQSNIKLSMMKNEARLAAECLPCERNDHVNRVAEHLSKTLVYGDGNNYLSKFALAIKIVNVLSAIAQLVVLWIFFNYNPMNATATSKHFATTIGCEKESVIDNLYIDTKCILHYNYVYSIVFILLTIWYVASIVFGVGKLFYTGINAPMIMKRVRSARNDKAIRLLSRDAVYTIQKLIDYGDLTFADEVLFAMNELPFITRRSSSIEITV